MQQLSSNTLLHGGTYKIVKMLGQGSFGITYLAEHTSLGKKVAIKEFFMKELNSRGDDGSITGMSDGSLSHNYGQKFKKEAINLSRLEHPNIVRVTDSFDENGTYYYVMDYIEGMNLNDYIKRYHPSEQTAVEIIKEVAKALEYMHDEKHMLHLDLKPGNIMRRKGDGHIFLIDFGLSKHYDGNGAPETSTTIGLGTAGYAPIEQSNQAKNGEFRPTIDVYALGATLYKLLTGETPPVASELVSDDELLADKLKEKNISQPLIDLVIKAMLPNIRKRIQTMREFYELLTTVDNRSVPPIGVVIANGAESVDVKDEETKVVGNSEETELITSKPIQGNEADHEKFEEKQYTIPSSYITNFDETKLNAGSGNVAAMLALGFMYLRGEGVTQNFDIAYFWFTRANNHGDYRARKIVAGWMQIKDRYILKTTNSSSVSSTSNPNNIKHDENNNSEVENNETTSDIESLFEEESHDLRNSVVIVAVMSALVAAILNYIADPFGIDLYWCWGWQEHLTELFFIYSVMLSTIAVSLYLIYKRYKNFKQGFSKRLTIITSASAMITLLIYKFCMGSANNFVGGDPEGEVLNGNIPGILYTSGLWIVLLLFSMLSSFIIVSVESYLLNKEEEEM